MKVIFVANFSAMPVLMLTLHQLTYHLEVVLLSASTEFLAICRVVLGGTLYHSTCKIWLEVYKSLSTCVK